MYNPEYIDDFNWHDVTTSNYNKQPIEHLIKIVLLSESYDQLNEIHKKAQNQLHDLLIQEPFDFEKGCIVFPKDHTNKSYIEYYPNGLMYLYPEDHIIPKNKKTNATPVQKEHYASIIITSYDAPVQNINQNKENETPKQNKYNRKKNNTISSYSIFNKHHLLLAVELKIYTGQPVCLKSNLYNGYTLDNLTTFIQKYKAYAEIRKTMGHTEYNTLFKYEGYELVYNTLHTLYYLLCNYADYTDDRRNYTLSFRSTDLKDKALMLQEEWGVIQKKDTSKIEAVTDFVLNDYHKETNKIQHFNILKIKPYGYQEARNIPFLYGNHSANKINEEFEWLKSEEYIHSAMNSKKDSEENVKELSEALEKHEDKMIYELNLFLEQVENIDDPYIRKFFSLVGVLPETDIPDLLSYKKRIEKLKTRGASSET